MKKYDSTLFPASSIMTGLLKTLKNKKILFIYSKCNEEHVKLEVIFPLRNLFEKTKGVKKNSYYAYGKKNR